MKKKNREFHGGLVEKDLVNVHKSKGEAEEGSSVLN